MRFVKQWLETASKCGAQQLTASESIELKAWCPWSLWPRVLHCYNPPLIALRLQLGSRGQPFVSPRSWYPAPESSLGLIFQAEDWSASAWRTRDSGQCGQHCLWGGRLRKPLDYPRKEARDWWAKTESNMIMRRSPRLCVSWKVSVPFITGTKHLRHFTKDKT